LKSDFNSFKDIYWVQQLPLLGFELTFFTPFGLSKIHLLASFSI